LKALPIKKDSNTIVSFDQYDDAGIYKINNSLIVQTIDVITPVVDDPYIFGRIVAVNAMSDIFAMGGIPKTALSFLSYNLNIESAIIKTILEGAINELNKENCILLGGHTVEDQELKCGFAITGIIEDNRIYRNNTLKVDDEIILTKKIGTGIISTAIKADMASNDAIGDAVDSMVTSNNVASKIMKNYNITACTDVTGFSLIGHLYEMVQTKDLSVCLNFQGIPILNKALEYISMGLIPGGAYRNKNFLKPVIDFKNINDDYAMLLFDPQTSGGLIIGVNKNESKQLLKHLKSAGYPANIIGKVTEKKDKPIYVI
jgi:selenide,water dikinase